MNNDVIYYYTWCLENTYKNIKKDIIENILEKCFSEWSKYANIEFKKSCDNPTIKIGFYSKNHRDAESFDGVGGILAHTSTPETMDDMYDIFIHFDADENWYFHENSLIDYINNKTVSFQTVALHEIGHALGVKHLDKYNSVMYPDYNTLFKLSRYDVINIQKIFGKRYGSLLPQNENPISVFIKTNLFNILVLCSLLVIYIYFIYSTNKYK